MIIFNDKAIFRLNQIRFALTATIRLEDILMQFP